MEPPLNKRHVISYDKETAVLRSLIPLDKLQSAVEESPVDEVTQVDFCLNGYCTDAVLWTLRETTKAPLTNLTEIDLTGCTLLTDRGIKWLVDVLKRSPNSSLSKVCVDGCGQLTDHALALLCEATSDRCTIDARGTDIRYLKSVEKRTVHTEACPLLVTEKGAETSVYERGHVMVIPQASIRTSVANYLKTKSSVTRGPIHHVKNCSMGKMDITLTEMSLDHPLLDVMVGKNPVQVIIPYDATSQINDIKTHVLDTISRVTAKETVCPQWPERSADEDLSNEWATIPFMDVNTVANQVMKDNTLRNLPKGEVIGCYFSRQSLTRSHPSFEVTCTKSESGSGDKVGILIGCLFDAICPYQDPMGTDVDVGGEVESFETVSGSTYQFGIEGEWESEYVPLLNSYTFYTMVDGKPHEGELLNKNKQVYSSCFPLVAALGEGGEVEVTLNYLIKPPQAFQEKYEKKTILRGFVSGGALDDDGNFSALNSNPGGFFIAQNAVSTTNNVFSFKILDPSQGKTENIYFGFTTYASKPKVWRESQESFIYHGDCNEVSRKGHDNEKDVFPEGLSKGDTITVTVRFTSETAVAEVELRHKPVKRSDERVRSFTYEPVMSGSLCASHFVIELSEPDAQVQLLGYRPHYRMPALIPRKVTVGKLHIMKCSDDGKLVALPEMGEKTMFGTFVAKTSLHKDLLYFEVKVQEPDTKTKSSDRIIGVGLCESYFVAVDFLGEKCSVGYHNNGTVQFEGMETKNPDLVYGTSDVIGCGIEAAKGKSLQFTRDGNLVCQQKVLIYFTKNGQRVYEKDLLWRWDALLPSVSMVKGYSVRILNFYPESTAVRQKLVREEEERKRKETELSAPVTPVQPEKSTEYTGCEFIIVGMADEDADITGKAQLVKEQIDLMSHFPALTDVTKHLQDIKMTLGDLDIQGQNNFTSLCAMEENFLRLSQDKGRLHFLSSNVTTDKGHSEVLRQVEDTFQAHMECHAHKYQMTQARLGVVSKIKELLEKDKLQEAEAELFSVDDMCSDVFTGLLHTQQNLGDLLLLQQGSRKIAVDVEFLFDVMSTMEKIANMTMSGSSVMAVGSSCHVWTEETFTKVFHGLVGKGKVQTLVQLMQDYLGLVLLPCFRLAPSDPKFLFTTLASLATPPVSLKDFWSKGEAGGKNCILVQCTYSFLHQIPDHILTLVLGRMTQYGRTVLLTSEGAVFQLGAVQTVIIKHKDLMEKGVISVESRCYFPDEPVDPVNELTETTVKEYAWQVFCLYTDLIDMVLLQQNLTPVISRNVPKGLVNVSVGCKHTWKAFDSKQLQSVCTLCNNCVENGIHCPWNGIVGNNMRECGCKTSCTGCHDCGICGRCAEALWMTRSELRPNPMLSMKDVPTVPLDPLAYNEIEVTHLSGVPPRICLRDVNDGSLIRVFPGLALSILEPSTAKQKKKDDKTAPQQEEKKKQETQLKKSVLDIKKEQLAKKASNTGEDKERLEKLLKKLDKEQADVKHKYSTRIKDTIQLRITDPLRSLHFRAEEIESETQESRIVYHPLICRAVRVHHESGILCYDPESGSVPVGQFMGPSPFSSTFTKFSFEVISTGSEGELGIGICNKTYSANRMPGWDKFSIGYHGDNGGLYVERGSSTKLSTELFEAGDIITCELQVQERMVSFFRNEKEVYSMKVESWPREGYFPMIAMHSAGECIRILEKDPWLPNEDHPSIKATAFDTHKYGNLFISPAHVIHLKRRAYYGGYYGWIVLYNPSKGKIGYKKEDKSQPSLTDSGVLESKESKVFSIMQVDRGMKPILIKWIDLEKSKSYTSEMLEEQFNKASKDDSIYTHSLQLMSQDKSGIDKSGIDDGVEMLTMIQNDLDPKDKNVLSLEVFKNKTLVNKYWLKKGSYRLELPLPEKTGSFLLKSPKCPSFLYPSSLQKGMKIVVKVDNDLAEAVITELAEDGGACLSYTPEGKGEMETLTLEAGTLGIDSTDWRDDVNVLLLKLDSDRVHLNNTFIPAPPFLTTMGSAKALLSLDPDWITNTLTAFSTCGQVLTRVTVQEQLLTYQSRTLEDWLEGYPSLNLVSWMTKHGSPGNVDAAFAMMPRQLDGSTLKFPRLATMFDSVAIHRLCSIADQLLHFSPFNKVKLKIPIHFVDIPGFVPEEKIPVDLSYGCQYQGWVYIALLAHRIMLPSYTNLFNGELDGLSRPQIESLFYRLVQPYASLCGVFASQVGGLTNQVNPYDVTDKVGSMLQDQDLPYTATVIKEPMSDSHKLVNILKLYSCKAHQLSIVDFWSLLKDVQLKYIYFEPYNSLVTAFSWELPNLPSLPDDFFSKFSNLQCFSLIHSRLSEKPTIPPGIENCAELQTIVLEKLGVSKLPPDLLKGPALKSVTCSNLLVKKIDFDWPENSHLTRLVLSGLLITSLPPGISKLKFLKELNLDHNILTALPDSLKDLPKLRILSLKGIPWITFEGIRTSVTREQYEAWNDNNPIVRNTLGRKTVDEFFNQFDTNYNSELDEEELAHLNLHLFMEIPRLTTTGTDEFGGIPPVIFELKTLQELYLSNQGITMVPKELSQLQNLQVLDCRHCPLLEKIEGSVGLMPNIKSIRLTGCPSLRTPPNEVVSRGFESIRAYLKRLAGGFTKCRRTKLMFVGLGGAGKTSLLQALRSKDFKTSGTQNAMLTDGIEIEEWTVKSETGLDITYSTWDFAGQTVYYNTHQFFLSNRAVYLLLWSMRQGFEQSMLDFWLSSIACHAPKTPILVVGTQCDQVPKIDVPEDELKKRYPQITSFHFVSSIDGTGIADLKKQLIACTLDQTYMGEAIPKVWLNLEKKIQAERQSKQNVLMWEVVKNFAIENGIYDDKDVRMAVKFLDDLGVVQYFDNDFLSDRVVINPQWIVKVMACVVSVKQSRIKERSGWFLHEHMSVIWEKYDEKLHPWLLRLTEEFDLTFPLPLAYGNINIVPCLLPQAEPKELRWPDIDKDSGIRENKFVYKFTYLPAGLFNRAQVRLFQFSDGKLIWKKGSMLNKNRHLALIRQENDTELVVLVQGPQPENILLLIHEVFESLIKESFHGIKYDLFIPCPDCISKEGTKEPCLFKSDLVDRAVTQKAPFLQCTKYFHTVSMGQLLEMMPEEKDSDFDIHLQHSISALQNLNKSMENDVAILYCRADLPGSDSNKIDPCWIKQDLEQSGLSCWFPDMNGEVKMHSLIMALKNCKVLVVLMSDEFETDQNCNDLLQYAIQTLDKPFHVACVKESQAWQSSALGYLIGNPGMAMLKTVARYKEKKKDLLSMVQVAVDGVNNTMEEHPVCFISYAWCNSRQAVKLGTKEKPGSLGWGDPRDIKDFLEKKKIKCWLDLEQMSTLGLCHDIAVGLQNCKVMVACVSEEYMESKACMMELRFGMCNMDLPVVVVVVGTGKKWKRSEIGLLMRRQQSKVNKVNMQEENADAWETIYQHVQNALIQPGNVAQDHGIKKDTKTQMAKKTSEESHLSYKEEYELIQRKFMRHITTSISQLDLPVLPRLLVFDFLKVPSMRHTESHIDQDVDLNIRPKSSKRRTDTRDGNSTDKPSGDDMESDWQQEEKCIRVLCEHEEGWHLMGKPLTLKTRTFEEIENCLKDASPYLARIYTILHQTSLRLNCLNSRNAGETFRKWIDDQQASIEKELKSSISFLQGYERLIRFVHELEEEEELEVEDFTAQLDRCRLPSGKISWLCETHQKGSRITKLASGDVGKGEGGKNTLFKEDVLFKELLDQKIQNGTDPKVKLSQFQSASKLSIISVAVQEESQPDLQQGHPQISLPQSPRHGQSGTISSGTAEYTITLEDEKKHIKKKLSQKHSASELDSEALHQTSTAVQEEPQPAQSQQSVQESPSHGQSDSSAFGTTEHTTSEDEKKRRRRKKKEKKKKKQLEEDLKSSDNIQGKELTADVKGEENRLKRISGDRSRTRDIDVSAVPGHLEGRTVSDPPQAKSEDKPSISTPLPAVRERVTTTAQPTVKEKPKDKPPTVSALQPQSGDNKPAESKACVLL